MRKIKRMKEKEEREDRKQRDEEMKSIRKLKKKEERERKLKEKEDRKRIRVHFTEEQIMVASQYVCGDCKEMGRPDDEVSGILWFGCDEDACGTWYHEHCLTQHAKEYLWESLDEGEEWFCHRCKPWLYEE